MFLNVKIKIPVCFLRKRELCPKYILMLVFTSTIIQYLKCHSVLTNVTYI